MVVATQQKGTRLQAQKTPDTPASKTAVDQLSARVEALSQQIKSIQTSLAKVGGDQSAETMAITQTTQSLQTLQRELKSAIAVVYAEKNRGWFLKLQEQHFFVRLIVFLCTSLVFGIGLIALGALFVELFF